MAKHLVAGAAARPEGSPGRRRALDVALWAAFAVLLVCLAVGAGFEGSFTNDYSAINGDWQAYNPVRRLLAGQTPYADYGVYLGAGELYTVGAVLLAIGDTFGNSMFATSFLTFLFFELFVLACAVAVFGSWGRARTATALMVCLSLYVMGFAPTDTFLKLGIAPSNSDRMIRLGGMVVGVLVIQAVLTARRGVGRTRDDARPLSLVAPIVAGALVPWSNDVGIAFYCALSLHYAVVYIAFYARGPLDVVAAAARYVLVSLAAFFVGITVASLGHPLSWLSYTMQLGSSQGWFFDIRPTKLVSVLGIRIIPVVVLLALLLAALAARAVREGGPRELAGSLGLTGSLVALTVLAWHFVYVVGNRDTDGIPEGLYLASFVLGAFLLARVALDAVRAPRPAPALAASLASVALMAVATGAYGTDCLETLQAGRPAGYAYDEALDAWLTEAGGGMVAQEAAVVGDGTVWSTYAGALEAETGQFQPSGTDYIIHVLGDGLREHYLETFEEASPDFVSTPAPTYSSWTGWVRNADWWFYRVLYRDWEPSVPASQVGGAHTLWQRSGEGALDAQVDVTVEQVGADTVRLNVTAADPTLDAVADVRVFLDAGGSFALGGLSPVVFADSPTEDAVQAELGLDLSQSWYLPAGTEQYVPVTIHDGTGTLVLTCRAAASPTLSLTDVSVEGVYRDWEYTAELG